MRVRARVVFSQTGSVSGERASPAVTVNAEFERPPSPGESQIPFLEESEPTATAYDRGFIPTRGLRHTGMAGRPRPRKPEETPFSPQRAQPPFTAGEEPQRWREDWGLGLLPGEQLAHPGLGNNTACLVSS